MISAVNKKTDLHNFKLFTNTFYHFIEVFKKLSIEQLKNDHCLLQEFTACLNANDYLFNKAFQSAFEVAFSKRHFSVEDLSEIYKTAFMLKNPCNKFDIISAIDHTTTFNIFQALFVKRQLVNVKITVLQTPVGKINFDTLDLETKTRITLNKNLTGNSFPDLELNDIPYDFKHTKNPTNTLNHVHILLNSDKGISDFRGHINDLYRTYIIKKEIQKFPKEYQNTFKDKLETLWVLLKTNPSRDLIKYENTKWNDFIINHPQRPTNARFPLYMLTSKSFIPKEIGDSSLKDFDLKEGRLDYPKTKEALIKYLATESQETKEKIFVATISALGQIQQNMP